MRRSILWGAAGGALLLLVVLLASSGVLGNRVAVSWSYDYTRQPACSSDKANNCVAHFEILDYTDSHHPKLLRSVPNPQNAVGSIDNISDQFSYGPPFGRRTIVVVAVARDENGTPIKSNPYAAREDVEIRPNIGRAKE